MKLSELAAVNGLLDDSHALANRYQHDGCLLIRQALGPRVVDEITRQAWDVLDRAGLAVPPGQAPDGELRWTGTPVGCWDLMELDSIPALQTLVEGFPTPTSPVRTFVEATRGHPAYLYRGSGFFIAFPDDPAYVTPPHQDGWADSSQGDYRRVWIPITHIPFGDGGLALAPGSHRLGHLARRDFPELRDRPTPEAPTPTRRIRGVNPDVVDDHWHTAEFSPGDALIFHIDLLHRGLPPTSNRIRLALSVMTASATDPHPTPETNDFTLPELLTRKRTLWRLAQPLGLTHDELAKIHRHLLTHGLPVNENNLRNALTGTLQPEDAPGS